jgi:hypothetical protein
MATDTIVEKRHPPLTEEIYLETLQPIVGNLRKQAQALGEIDE